MAQVRITDEALGDIARLPLRIQARVESVVDRLEKWPNVSGVKALAGDRKGQYRIRTGDFRVVFIAIGPAVTIIKVGNRRDVYED